MKYIAILEYFADSGKPHEVKWCATTQDAEAWLSGKLKENGTASYIRCTIAECLFTIDN